MYCLEKGGRGEILFVAYLYLRPGNLVGWLGALGSGL